jgi:hypothetical protein
MTNPLLILLLAQVEYSEARFISLAQAKVSKRFYSSKAKGYNVHNSVAAKYTVQ